MENLRFLWGNIGQPANRKIKLHSTEFASSYLGYERNKLPKVLGLFVWVDLKYFPDALIVVPLLQKFLFICWCIPFDEIL